MVTTRYRDFDVVIEEWYWIFYDRPDRGRVERMKVVDDKPENE